MGGCSRFASRRSTLLSLRSCCACSEQCFQTESEHGSPRATNLLIIVGRYGGLLAFCLAAFYGIGAYAHTLLRVGGGRLSQELLFSASVPFPMAVIGAALAGGLVALLIGLVALRFRGDFFVFTTLGFQMIVFVVLYNWTGLSRGAFGIYGIPRPELFGWQVRTLGEYRSEERRVG